MAISAGLWRDEGLGWGVAEGSGRRNGDSKQEDVEQTGTATRQTKENKQQQKKSQKKNKTKQKTKGKIEDFAT